MWSSGLDTPSTSMIVADFRDIVPLFAVPMIAAWSRHLNLASLTAAVVGLTEQQPTVVLFRSNSNHPAFLRIFCADCDHFRLRATRRDHDVITMTSSALAALWTNH